MATLEALQQDWLCVKKKKKPPVAYMLSVYSSCQRNARLTMTQKDLAIDRRRIPTQEKGIGSKVRRQERQW